MTKGNRGPRGARLTLPRDLQFAYFIGKLSIVKISDVWRVFYGSEHTCRAGLGRLVRLGLVRSFPRVAPSLPKWFALTPKGLAWVAEETGCGEELRAPSGITRTNLVATTLSNRFWVSLLLATRTSLNCKLSLVRPEAELRRLRTAEISVVPDALVALSTSGGAVLATTSPSRLALMVELDSGSERLGVWEDKSRNYRVLRDRGALFGEERWVVLALVPSRRRATTLASAIIKGGAGAFTYLAEAAALDEGRALERHLWSPTALVGDPAAPPQIALPELVSEVALSRATLGAPASLIPGRIPASDGR